MKCKYYDLIFSIFPYLHLLADEKNESEESLSEII